MSSSAAQIKKRLVLCCDGTWMDSDDGYNKPTLIPYVPTGTLQIPSNVTRISRGLKKTGLDGSPQIIYYHSGVGTGPGFVDAIGGGLLGTGISENIREVYSFIAANYTPGDDIILIGFSRGAFTARSVAAMIGSMGLLTRTGMSSFYPIFKDYENFMNPHYNDIFPTIPFPNKPKGSGAAHDYKRRLEAEELTRVYDPDGTKIRVQSVAVWDTVGSLGIPQVSWLARMGLPHSTKEYRFNDTNLDGTVRHAFQALALDEHRNPFSPAVWERMDMRKCTVDLRQVWFPGAHSNVGGGYDDQEIANISLAWMMDQLASIGVAFQSDYIDQIFADSVRYYYNPRKLPARVSNIFARPVTKQWAIEPVFEKHKPVRPWGLGEIYESEIGFYKITGKRTRTPGMNCRADPQTGLLTDEWMTNTNERIHRCVRVRLELEGLDLDDRGIYKATALQRKGMWRLAQTRTKIDDPIPWDASWGPDAPAPAGAPEDRRWVWEYDGPDEEAPPERIMVEEPLGPYERKLILLNKGELTTLAH
ncbi:hypothetical protein F5882DRAFT_83505 [Hyaloscypha sp. PMI_1271]|nr:hypothetical protein F5882DRAFT_83505 [Hyaloscypha sp. PMI_1271]